MAYFVPQFLRAMEKQYFAPHTLYVAFTLHTIHNETKLMYAT